MNLNFSNIEYSIRVNADAQHSAHISRSDNSFVCVQFQARRFKLHLRDENTIAIESLASEVGRPAWRVAPRRLQLRGVVQRFA